MSYSHDLCKCCLTNRYILKDLWGINLIQGHREVYGEMITECFALSWQKPVDRMELICESCIKTLLIAFKFKRDVLASEQILLKQLKDEDNECDETVKEDMIDDNDIHEDLVPDEDSENKTISVNFEHWDETVVENIKKEPDYFEVVYLEDSINVEPVKEEKGESNFLQKQETTNENESCSPKDLEKCLKASTSKKLIPIVVLDRYLPKKTEQLKQKEIKATEVSQNKEVCSSQLTKTHEDKEEPKAVNSKSQPEHGYKKISAGFLNKREKRQINLQLCLTAIKSGRLTATAASVLYNIPVSTLYRILARDEDKPNITANSPVLKQASSCALSGQNMPSSSSLAQQQCTRAASTSSRDVEQRGERTANKFICDICKGVFKSKISLSRHILHIHKYGHKSKKGSTCKICNKKFSYNSQLIKHQRVHTGEKPYPCKICNKKFSQYGYLITHERIHTGEKPYSCKICSKKFSRNAYLITHLRIHTGEKPYSCKICNKQFLQRSHLIRHQGVHTGEKPYSCKICNKQFLQTSDLIRHQRIHTGEKPYSCKICNKQFSGSGHLIRHQRNHTGEKPYSCIICNKQFSRNERLITHQRIHTGEKPYSCEICSKQFSDISTRNKHQRVHTGEKPYTCKICTKNFSRRSHLIKHEHTHSGDRR